MDNIPVKNIFAAVYDKSNLDKLAVILRYYKVNVLGTVGTAKYLKAKGVNARPAVPGFDFDGRVKSIDYKNFAAILADSSKKNHLTQLSKLGIKPIQVVVVDLYKPEKKGFPESMDIGGQALIRAAVKNYKNVAVAFDAKSIADLEWELTKNKGTTSVAYRKRAAVKALKFIVARGKLESAYF
jgi:phosphoribosylaminoimidazolecarboxamide formyltransferase/IMP cyclohydrolase